MKAKLGWHEWGVKTFINFQISTTVFKPGRGGSGERVKRGLVV